MVEALGQVFEDGCIGAFFLRRHLADVLEMPLRDDQCLIRPHRPKGHERCKVVVAVSYDTPAPSPMATSMGVRSIPKRLR